MNARDHLAAALEENAEELIAAAVDAAKRGEWRALMALMDRVYGRPTETVQHEVVEIPKTVQEIRNMSSAERRALLRQHEEALAKRETLASD
jgi:hypothetical protein